MASEENKEMKRVLIFGGKTGWIGGLMMEMVAKEGTVISLVSFESEQKGTPWPDSLRV